MGSPISSAELRKRRSDWHRTGLIISTSDYTKSPAARPFRSKLCSTKILIQFRQLAAQWIQWLVASLDC